MSKEDAKKFFDRLTQDKAMQVKVKDGLEKLAEECHFDVTEEELSEELQRRWECTGVREGIVYSEPPGF